MQDRLPVALIGCGRFGAIMSALLAQMDEYRVTAVYDADAARAAELADQIGAVCAATLDDCLAMPVRAVMLFTPNHLHCRQAVAAARAGKHIFCEKPMALDTEQCYAMIEAADRAGVRLMVGHKRRLRPQYAKMAELVRSNCFGRLLAVDINGFFLREVRGWWTNRQTGGGLLPNASVHDIDFLRHIGGEIGSVFARSPVKTNHTTDFEDALSLLLQFESGATATLQSCPLWPLAGFHQSFGVRIVLERGGILYDPQSVTVSFGGIDGNVETLSYDNEAGFREAYRTELSSFARWVLAGEKPVLTAWDGLRCVEVMEAAALSAYSGKEVQLPLPKTDARRSVFGPVSSRRTVPEPQLFARGFSMAEGPAFDRSGFLYVANCRADFVSRVSAAGESSHFVTTGGKTQGVAIRPDGKLLVTDFLERKIFLITPQGEIERSFDRYRDGRPLRGPNEITLGSNGQVYFTDPGPAWRGRATGAVARLDAEGQAEILAENLEFTNGLDFSPDGKWMYVVESTTGKILRARLAADGSLTGALEEFVRFPGRVGPDGIRFAANGDLYVALFGHGVVAVVAPNGDIADTLRVPGLFPTNVIFAGTDLLVCEGQTGSIWRMAIGVEGLPSYSERVWRGTLPGSQIS